MIVLMGGNPRRPRDGVVKECPRHELAVIVVPHRFVQRATDRLNDAAEHLILDQRRVDRSADILDDDVVEQVDLAGLIVHADVGEMAGDRRRDCGVGRRSMTLDGRRVAVAQLGCDLRDRSTPGGRTARSDESVDDLEIFGLHLERFRGQLREPLACVGDGLLDREP